MIKENPLKRLTILASILILFVIIFISCKDKVQTVQQKTVHQAPAVQVKHLEWTKNANIYEVNIRQFTPEGTLKAFEEQIPRLKDLGIDIIWLMPVNPIGEKNRKGTLGSYYSIKDYLAVNPEYGTLMDMKSLVTTAHAMNMHVIIDWVANHTSWDNNLLKEHHEFYKTDSTGKLLSPFDWSDVLQLNYKNRDLWEYMISAMKFWIEATGIDGFRCDVAGMVPTEFWNKARADLDKVKPVFMLAEAEQPDLLTKAFDADYGWELYHIMNGIAQGKKKVKDIDAYFQKIDTILPVGAYKMYFTSNHDENSWNGTEFERLGDAAKTFAVFAATVPGIPLIYNGQEVAFNRRLQFFEKDSIDWKDNPEYTGLYKTLLELKKNNEALWNGSFGGSFTKLMTSADTSIYAFAREKDSNIIVAIFNLTPTQKQFKITIENYNGEYMDAFSGDMIKLRKKESMMLNPWEYRIYIKESL
jgi:1,4-alpha-glucan branching enzyme